MGGETTVRQHGLTDVVTLQRRFSLPASRTASIITGSSFAWRPHFVLAESGMGVGRRDGAARHGMAWHGMESGRLSAGPLMSCLILYCLGGRERDREKDREEKINRQEERAHARVSNR